MGETPEPLEFELDRSSTVAIYLQLADELRYRVATGAIAIGQKLPTVAQGAALWGVNLHTVRQAYTELAYDGIAEMRRGKGTFITATPAKEMAALSPGATAGVASFVDWIASHAQRSFGLDREGLAELLTVAPPAVNTEGGLCFVECSMSQSSHHASEIGRKWNVRTRGWSLEWDKEPPPGPFVSTYFHYNDIRRRWPHRMGDANFVSIHPARSLKGKVQRCRKDIKIVNICLYELSETMARSIAADVTADLLDVDCPIQYQVVPGSAKDIRIISNVLYLFPPRLWWELHPAQQAQPNVLEIEYEIAEGDMARLAHHFGWSLRTSS